MNRKKAKTGNGIYKIAAILAAAVLLAGIGLPGQTALVSHASNSLGSQGSALDGGNASDAGSEAVDEGAADNTDEEVQAVIDENTEDLNGTSTASRIRVIAASGRVRAEASTDSSVVGSLSSGDEMDVVGETTGSDGYVWYQISGEKNGEAVNGYVRSDVVEVTETTQPETTEQPATETPSEPASESAATSTDEYSVSYADDGTGVSDWYLNDNINGTRYRISELLGAAQTNESNISVMEEQTGTLRMIIIILAVIIALLVVVVTVLIFKLRGAYEEEGYDEDDDYYGDEEDEDEDDEDDEDEEEDDEDEYLPRRSARRGGRGRRMTRSRRYEEEDEDEMDEDEEERYEEDRYDEDEEPPRRSSRQSGSRQSGSRQTSRGKSRNAYKPRNFLDVDDDDDLDFEFLDLK